MVGYEKELTLIPEDNIICDSHIENMILRNYHLENYINKNSNMVAMQLLAKFLVDKNLG